MAQITIDNYNDLLSRTNLSNLDLVIFPYKNTTICYLVHDCYLSPFNNEEAYYETEIIKHLIQLGLIAVSVSDYCSLFYGYLPRNSSASDKVWPECLRNDYGALTRLVFDIFKRLESIQNYKNTITLTPINNISFLQ